METFKEQDMSPLLTVIVTCYNVEKYLDKCILSIVYQTYTNLEILLIDDGSPDKCGEICDAWQEKDQRIRAIHKQNEGLAYARKTGIENATAEYVTFVDADDWIHVDMYSNMMAALLSTGSDIAQCGVCMVYEDGSIKHRYSNLITGTFEIVGRIEGVLLIIENDKWMSWMWNKIFKKHLFDGINFFKGNSYAEDFISHYLFHKANQSVYFSDEYCFYLQRSESITGSTNFFQKSSNITDSPHFSKQLKNHCDYFESWFDRFCFVNQHPEYHSKLPHIKMYVLFIGIGLLRNILVFPKYFDVDYFRKNAEKLSSIFITRKDKLPRGLKIEFYILKYAGAISYKFMRTLYVAILNIMNRLKIKNRPTYTLFFDLKASFWNYWYNNLNRK